MIALILTVVAVFLLLVGSEYWWRSRRPHDELSRKFIHISVGMFAAFWPFFLSWRQILLLSVAFIVVVVISKYLHIFQAIHAVERPTWGEIFFAVAVGALTFVTHDKWIYAAALLHMGLADGLAAVTGVKWGKASCYRVFGHPKSLVGSLTFFVISVAILLSYSFASGHSLPAAVTLGVAVIGTALENLGVAGLDNLFVPLLVCLVLRQVG